MIKIMFAVAENDSSPILSVTAEENTESFIWELCQDIGPNFEDFIMDPPKTQGIYVWEGRYKTVYYNYEEADFDFVGNYRLATMEEIQEFCSEE